MTATGSPRREEAVANAHAHPRGANVPSISASGASSVRPSPERRPEPLVAPHPPQREEPRFQRQPGERIHLNGRSCARHAPEGHGQATTFPGSLRSLDPDLSWAASRRRVPAHRARRARPADRIDVTCVTTSWSISSRWSERETSPRPPCSRLPVAIALFNSLPADSGRRRHGCCADEPHPPPHGKADSHPSWSRNRLRRRFMASTAVLIASAGQHHNRKMRSAVARRFQELQPLARAIHSRQPRPTRHQRATPPPSSADVASWIVTSRKWRWSVRIASMA